MRCAKVKKLLSPYLDGMEEPSRMHAVEEHLAECDGCSHDYELLRQTRCLVVSLRDKPAPASLHWQLRAALTRELVRSRRRSSWAEFLTESGNRLNAFLVPATAGVLSAVICFGLLIGSFDIPTQLHPAAVRSGALGLATPLDNDVPTALYSPPQLKVSPFESGMGNISADSIVLEAYVDVRGRVQDYKILVAPKDIEQHLPQLNNMLIFTIFRPAMAFGRPTLGKAVLSFSEINVKG